MKQLSVLRMLRVLRVVRMVRLLRIFKELWLIVKGILESTKTIAWVSLLLLMILYVCAIFFTQMIGFNAVEYESFPETYVGAEFNPFQYFGNIWRTMFTLFNIVLMTGDWDITGRAVVETQPSLFPFFLFFILFTTFGVMNVIIGVIVDNTMEAARANQDSRDNSLMIHRVELLEKIRLACFAFDTNGSGEIDVSELSE